MGNFAVAKSAFKNSKSAYDADPSFFYVIPKAAKLTKVTVRLTPITGRGKTVLVTSKQVEQAAQWNYYAVRVQIPAAGTWRFTVTSGAEHGCFEAKFTT